MYGAIIGDIIGSTYEHHNTKTQNFELFPAGSRFTDDTVLSVAVAEKILNQKYSQIDSKKSYALWYKQYYHRYPSAGYGQMFQNWANDGNLTIQRSYGNGAAMRVSAIGFAFDSTKEILKEVKNSCYFTHNNREAITGASAIAMSIFLARNGIDKDEIRHKIEEQFKYNLSFTLNEIRDSDTIACMVGGIA